MRGEENHVRLSLCILFILLTVCVATEGRVIYVDASAVGANDGSSWADAFNYLQDALITASDGGEIRVAQGVYTPDIGIGIMPGDRAASFQLINGVTIKGGFAGFGEPDPNAYDSKVYKTILSGDLNGDDLDIQDARALADAPSHTDNSFHVVTIRQVDLCVLDGLIISDGHAINGSGGLQIEDSSPTVQNCTFIHNWGSEGGAVFIHRGNSEIHNCRFLVNSSENYGGGLSINEGVLLLTDCEFTANTSTKGGAIWSGSADVSLSGCVVRENHAVHGGGLLHVNGDIYLTGCTFEQNSALRSEPKTFSNRWGGAMRISNSSGRQAVVTDCLFRSNRAFSGGAIHGDLTALRGCRFTGNVAHDRGGALDGRGSLACENCLFDGNKALDQAAAVRCLGSLLFTNCTFVDNRSPDGNAFAAFGGHGSPVDVVFTNCIVWGTAHGLDPENAWLSRASITYSDVQDGWPGEGNIDVEPCFVNLGRWVNVNDPNQIAEPNDPNAVWIDGDYHLKSQAGRWDSVSQMWIIDDVTSPCIDSGDPNSPVAFESFPNGGIINMGAYGGTAEASKSPSGIRVKYGGGTGGPNEPYLIYTAEHMNAIGAEPNDWDKHFKLMADIDLNDLANSTFNLIGSNSHSFKGVFDGNGHTISNLTYVVTGNEGSVDDAVIQLFGLFRYIHDPSAVIKDLSLVNPDIRPASTCQKWLWSVGALVGFLRSGSISNCSIEGGQVQGERMVGGLVGWNYGIISDCYTTCTVGPAEQRLLASIDPSFDERESFGGLVGYNYGEISNCHATGKVTGEKTVGGLVGETFSTIISNSWSGSDVSGDSSIGGLVGKNRTTSRLSHCYATGHVSGRIVIGGLVGNCKPEASIDNCYATGSVSAEQEAGGLVGSHEGTISECCSTASVLVNSDKAGGLVGLNGGTILTSWACGNVTGKRNIGGLVGFNWKEERLLNYNPIVTDSYAKGSVCGEDGVGGLIGTNQGGTVLRCYSTGRVTGATGYNWIGGLIGINSDISEGEIEDSFWDIITSGSNTSGGGTGKTTAEMQTASTFLEAGWDFVDEAANGTEDIWWILEGQDYPRLYWELMNGTEN